MFRITNISFTASIVTIFLTASQALALPFQQEIPRGEDEASPWVDAGHLENISEHRTFEYGSRWEGFGVLDISVDMSGDEFEVEIVDSPPMGAGCSIYSSHLDGDVLLEISPDCDMEALLIHLDAVAPDVAMNGRLGDWWSDSAADHAPGGGEDHSMPGGPYTEREDGTSGECTAAKGHCLMYVAAAAATGVGTAAVATPMAGAVIGSLALTGAALVCVGTIQDACGNNIEGILDDLFTGWPLDLIDPQQFLSYLDFLQYLESLVDVSSIGHVIAATPAETLHPAEEFRCSALLADLVPSLQTVVGEQVVDMVGCIEAGLEQ